MGDISDETDDGDVSVGPEHLLFTAHDVRRGLVDGEPDEDTGGRVMGGLEDPGRPSCA